MRPLKHKDLVSHNVRAGLELEYEGVSYRTTHNELATVHAVPLWSSKKDGSLRPRDQSTELTFARGLSGEVILDALEQLSCLNHLPYSLSWRCAMHVHIDYSGMYSTVAYRSLILSAVLEHILFKWAGPSRVESKFCAPTHHVSDYYMLPGKSFDPMKYTAYNLLPLRHLGTTELRVGDSTFDLTTMLDYINVGIELQRLSREFESGWDILESMVAKNNAAEWIDANMHPFVARVLHPVALEVAANEDWRTGYMSCAASLAEYEQNLTRFSV